MTEPLFPCTNALQTPNPPFWTTKRAVPKFPQNGGSTSTPCLDKAVHAQGGGGGTPAPLEISPLLSGRFPPGGGGHKETVPPLVGGIAPAVPLHSRSSVCTTPVVSIRFKHSCYHIPAAHGVHWVPAVHMCASVPKHITRLTTATTTRPSSTHHIQQRTAFTGCLQCTGVSRRSYHKHDTAPLSLHNRHTITFP